MSGSNDGDRSYGGWKPTAHVAKSDTVIKKGTPVFTTPGGAGGTATLGAVELIEERGKTHGDFRFQGACSQDLKDVVRRQKNWDALPGYMKEGVDMILHKVSRIMCGDWTEVDHCADIGGYAQCMVDRLPHDKHVQSIADSMAVDKKK